MKAHEFVIESTLKNRATVSSTSAIINSVNIKLQNIVENILPTAPAPEIYFNRANKSGEWSNFKRDLLAFRMKYNDGTKWGTLKMQNLSAYISEQYVHPDNTTIAEIKKIISSAFQHSVPASELVVGKKYDVAVVRLDKMSKIIEIDILHEHTVKSVHFVQQLDDYVVTTAEGLQGTTAGNNIEEIETLYFDNPGNIDKIEMFLLLRIGSEINDWKLSIISDRDMNAEETNNART